MTLLSRILGFVRDLVVARYFGADGATDAFFVAFRIPNFLRRLFAEGAFSQAFVPVLSEFREGQPPAATRRFLDRTAGMLVVVLGMLSAIGMVAAPLLVLLFAPGFHRHPEQFELAVEMLRITFPYLLFIGLTAFSGGILNTWGNFAVPAVTPVLLNLAMIAASLWLAPHLPEPVVALAFAVLLAGMLQLAFQMPALARLGLLPRPLPGLRDPGVRRLLRLMGPAIFGGSVGQLNLLLNTLIASFLISGSVSWLYYSDRLLEFPLGLFGVTIGTVLLPHLSRNQAGGNPAGFSEALDWGLRWVLLIGLPATVGLVILAEPLMFTLFQYDRFSADDTVMAARSLMAYSIGLIGFLGVKVLVPGFSARQDLVSPVRYGLYTVAVNMAASLLLVYGIAPEGWGHAGLALGTSLAAACNALLLLRRLLRDGAYRPAAGWGGFFARIVGASLAMSLLLGYGSANFAGRSVAAGERIAELALWIGSGAAVYLLCLAATGLRPRHLVQVESV